MSAPRRYAEGTKVPVSRTKGEIDKLLRVHGASQRVLATDEDRGLNIVMFTLPVGGEKRRQLRFELPHHVDDEREERRVWRVLNMTLKMKLELVRDGDSTVDAEFLPNVVLPDGRVVLDVLGEQIGEAYLNGKMPPLLGAAR